jgi:hypothetical protein
LSSSLPSPGTVEHPRSVAVVDDLRACKE